MSVLTAVGGSKVGEGWQCLLVWDDRRLRSDIWSFEVRRYDSLRIVDC